MDTSEDSPGADVPWLQGSVNCQSFLGEPGETWCFYFFGGGLLKWTLLPNGSQKMALWMGTIMLWVPATLGIFSEPVAMVNHLGTEKHDRSLGEWPNHWSGRAGASDHPQPAMFWCVTIWLNNWLRLRSSGTWGTWWYLGWMCQCEKTGASAEQSLLVF